MKSMGPSGPYTFLLLVGCLVAFSAAEPTTLAISPGIYGNLIGNDWTETMASSLENNSNSPCFPAVFAFGDSLTDTGNDLILHPPNRGYPHSETYLPRPRDTGKDGRLVIDFIAQALGLASPCPYMHPVRPNYEHGANFAAYGATATPVRFLVPYNLDIQTYWMTRFKANVLKLRARNISGSASQPLPQVEDFEKGLYYIAIGGNDYTALASIRNLSLFAVELAVPQVMAKLNSSITTLFDSGARNFMVVNLPPLGCSTAFRESYTHEPSSNIYLDFDEDECIRPFNDIVELHNDLLREMLRHFRGLHPDASFIYADYNAVIRQFLRTAREQGSGELPNSMADLAGGCPSESMGGCYNDIHIVSEAANRLATRDFLSGQFVEPQWAFNHCQFDLELS